jgi:hypothetical protein
MNPATDRRNIRRELADALALNGATPHLKMALCATLLGVAALGGLTAGCSTAPLPSTPATVDAAYGIPAGSVPANLQRPDGLLENGLLPAQSNG